MGLGIYSSKIYLLTHAMAIPHKTVQQINIHVISYFNSSSHKVPQLLCLSIILQSLPACVSTGRITYLKPRHQEIGEFYEVQKPFATDFKAPKL